MLVEKAYAKMYQSYWNIGNGGFAEDALKDLTGAPTEYIKIKDDSNPEEIWSKLQFCDSKNYIVVTGTKGFNGEK